MSGNSKPSSPAGVVDATARRYVLVGLLVTVASYAFLMALVLLTHIDDFAANFATLLFGLTLSFLLNRNFVFRHQGNQVAALARFVGVVAVAYGANLAALQLLLTRTASPPALAQFVAFSVYSVIAYVLHRLWTFAGRPQ